MMVVVMMMVVVVVVMGMIVSTGIIRMNKLM
jgi:hypothetical protein